jgi:glutamate/tyrosine decarboxylase-like PLP-dependent enzyme
MSSEPLLLDEATRAHMWPRVVAAIDDYQRRVGAARVAPSFDPAHVRRLLAPLAFNAPMTPEDAVDFVVSALWQHQVHVPHPRYYGLFNPAPATMGIVADALAAAFNPQIAAWSHNPFAAEVEQHLVRAFGERLGYAPRSTEGVFCSGGAEANHTALLAALLNAFPACKRGGVRSLAAQPVFYVSAEGHHSFAKAAQLSGIGQDACREVPTDDQWRLDVHALEELLRRDRRDGHAPFLIVATAGTTSAGIVDPLPRLAEIAEREELWLHVDAAWGGAAALCPELKHVLDGIDRADSITIDAHKWLSVPMGCGLFLTRRPGALRATFETATHYMPRDAAGYDVQDPYAHSMQWSRRFIGLKLFMTLLVAGWDGYAQVVARMKRRGDQLKRALADDGWSIVNRTELPVACFQDARVARGRTFEYLDAIARHVVDSGAAWLSLTTLGGLGATTAALRACITNYRTSAEDVAALVATLNGAREAWRTG